jgi:hypothetical protein
LDAVVVIAVAIAGTDEVVLDDIILDNLAVTGDTEAVGGEIGDYIAFTKDLRRAELDTESGVENVVVSGDVVLAVMSQPEPVRWLLDPVLRRPLRGVEGSVLFPANWGIVPTRSSNSNPALIRSRSFRPRPRS